MRPHVTAYTDCDLVHTSFVFAGLIDLANESLIDLEFKWPREAWSNDRGRYTVLLRVSSREGGTPRFGCVDVHDLSSYFSLASLRQCDAYFKSNYEANALEALPPDLRPRVQPLGLYFGCRSTNDRGLVTRHLGSIVSMLVKHRGKPRSAWGYDEAHRLRGIALSRLGRYRALLTISDYESDYRVDEVEGKVYFQTRAFPERDEPTRSMNMRRAALIRALRHEFGGRFIGGLIPSPEALELYPDCVSPLDSSLRAHIQRVRSSLICIYSNGLSNSFAWKLSEYMASAKCIVSENWYNQLPNPLVAGRDIFFFGSPEECVDQCASLLGDKSASLNARENIAAYYASYIRPSASMWRVVRSLFPYKEYPRNGDAE